MAEDPEVARAKALWKNKQHGQAMRVLVNRVNELNLMLDAMQGLSRPEIGSRTEIVQGDWRKFVRAGLFILLVIVFVGLLIYAKSYLDSLVPYQLR